ncbi:aminopeptidase N-like [Camponotus floridanus]|uniref:aminopeptidase N-like n=1 Tax=Camponotus floridanus TaxID=104421 RepID=UPI000DC69EC5|nr:aminopeptidase N-like [Camponotus floridanus]
MIFIKLLLSSSLIYMTAMTITISTNDEKSDVVWRNELNYNLSDTILPLHYSIRVIFLPKRPHLISECKIIINIMFATQHINFNLPNSKCILIGASLRQLCNGGDYPIKLPIYYGKNNIVMLDFDDFLLPGTYLLKIYFINNNFTINVSENYEIPFIKEGEDRRWLIVTNIQTKKQQIFPYWNNPELKVYFDISINHHRQYTVLSNMPIQISKPALYNTMWTHFHTTPLISIDSIVLVVTNYYQISNVINNKTVSMLYRPQLKSQMKFSLYIIENIIRYLQNNSMYVFEKTYVLFEKKVDVAILDIKDEVKQKLGFVFYREADIVYDEKLHPIIYKIRIAHIIARGMAQKCNLLSPSYWFDQWLNEGFKIYFETYIIEKALPNFPMMDLFVVQVQHELLDLNTYIVINYAIEYNIYSENYYSSLSHNKGFIIWRMLELTFSPDIFSKSIDIYLNNQFSEPEATTSSHLWNAMQSVMNALNYTLEFNIKSMIDSWATQSCFSVLEVMRNYSSNTVTISIRFHNKLDVEQYYIPVTYTTESKLNFNITWTNITWLTPRHSEIKFFFEEDQWIIFNLQQAGYYRVYYDTENWRKIGRYLNSKEYENIHVLNRAQIIDDAFHFAVEKELEFSVFWKIAQYLSNERDYIAWYPMIKAFEFMSNIFVFLWYYPQFQEVIRRMEFLILWNVSGEHNDHIECLKQEVAKWRCIADDFSCKTQAHNQLQEHLINPEKNKLSPGWKRWTYCNGLKIADNNIWNQVFNNQLMKKIDPMILECLANVEDSRILMPYFQSQLFDFMFNVAYYKPSERALTAPTFLIILAKNTDLLEEILNNFKNIVERRVNEITALTVIINNVYSKGQLDKITNFIRKKFQEPMIFDIERKIQTRTSEIERQIEFLSSFID